MQGIWDGDQEDGQEMQSLSHSYLGSKIEATNSSQMFL